MSFDVAGVRRQFPILSAIIDGQRVHYLDNGASAQTPDAVLEAVRTYETTGRANVLRGVHRLAERATEAYENARVEVAAFLGVAPMEIVFTDKTDKTPIYKFEDKLEENDRIRYEVPAKLEPGQLDRLKAAARGAFMSLGCRDVARIDFRMDEAGRIYFIECNPLPGLTPGWSDLVLIAQGDGMDYRTLIGEILSGAIGRYKERRSKRRDAAESDAA